MGDACVEAAGQPDFGLLGSTTAVLVRLEPSSSDGGALTMPLWQRCFEPHLRSAAASRCVRIILAMLKTEGQGGVRNAVLKAVRSQKKELQVAAKEAEANGEVVTQIRQILTITAAS